MYLSAGCQKSTRRVCDLKARGHFGTFYYQAYYHSLHPYSYPLHRPLAYYRLRSYHCIGYGVSSFGLSYHRHDCAYEDCAWVEAQTRFQRVGTCPRARLCACACVDRHLFCLILIIIIVVVFGFVFA